MEKILSYTEAVVIRLPLKTTGLKCVDEQNSYEKYILVTFNINVVSERSYMSVSPISNTIDNNS